MKFKLRGEDWSVKWCGRLRKLWGYCDHEENFIKVSKKATGVTKLDTIIHEALHGAFPDIKEEAVNEVGSDIAALLWKLGYRETDNVETD